MGSQLDLDQGGSYRQFVKRYLGPSVGWVWVPEENTLAVTTGGTTVVLIGTTLVTVNWGGPVAPTIQLPSAVNPLVPAGALPTPFANLPITIVDIGGFATLNPITILPAAGETIMNLASISLSVNYGGYTLNPNSAQKTWNSISP